MPRSGLFRLICLAIAPASVFAAIEDKAPPELDRHDTVFHSPSKDETGSIPMGNGEVGINLWTEEDGDLMFYASRNDSVAETLTLLKLGRVRLHLDPSPFRKGMPYRQQLKLRNGVCEITAGPKGAEAHITVAVDAASDNIHVKVNADQPTKAEVFLYNWRSDRRDFHNNIGNAVYPMRGAPADVDNWISADHWNNSESNAITAYHRNEYSVVDTHIKFQDMGQFADLVKAVDPIRNNTFGLRLALRGVEGERIANHHLRSKAAAKEFELVATAHGARTPDAATWFSETREIAAAAVSFDEVLNRTATYWNGYWNRSWIFISGDPVSEKDPRAEDFTDSKVTRAYILNKYQLACQMRSSLLANFQGGLFRVDPKLNSYALDYRDEASTPDDQFYGNSYWWQNTRFLYLPQMPQGAPDFYRGMLAFMNRLAPIMDARARKYYGAKGLYFEECFSPFGLPVMGDFGWGAKEYSEPYSRWTWQHGLEASIMMLDDYAYTRDAKFAREVGIPYAESALSYFETRFKRDENGLIRVFPTHALETYWTDVVNDTPSVAGLHYVVSRLRALPDSLSTPEQRKHWKELASILPPVARCTYKGKFMPDNAEVYQRKDEDRGLKARANYEAPDLYTVFPFRCYGLDIKTTDIQEAINAYEVMPNIEHACWNQYGIFSARLGQTGNARKDVIQRASYRMSRTDVPTRDPFRFPGFMGSPHDAMPDYDGPGNMMTILQEMLLQNGEKDELLLLQAWPPEWDARFKLHAFANTTIEGEVKGGKLIDLKVDPESRRKDLVIPAWAKQ